MLVSLKYTQKCDNWRFKSLPIIFAYFQERQESRGTKFSIFEKILVLTRVCNCSLSNLSCKPKIFKKFESWNTEIEYRIPNTEYRTSNVSKCALGNRRIFRSDIVMKDLRIVFDQSASVNVIHEIKSWNYNRNTTNLQQTLLSFR